MKKTIVIAVGCMLVLGFSGDRAAAAPIGLVIGDDYYVGSIAPANNASADNEAAFINHLITLGINASPVVYDGQTYSRMGSDLETDGFPEANSEGSVKNETGLNTGIVLPLTQSAYYILGKYDADNAGSLVWFVRIPVSSPPAGWDGTFTIPAEYNSHDLSHYTLFPNGENSTPVPDGGMTLILLGAALMGLGGLKRVLS